MLSKVITICLAQWNSRVQCPFLKLKQRAYRYKIINLPKNPYPFVWFWCRFVNICKDLQEYEGGGGWWRVRCVDILHNRFSPQNILGGLDYIKIPVTYLTLLIILVNKLNGLGDSVCGCQVQGSNIYLDGIVHVCLGQPSHS